MRLSPGARVLMAALAAKTILAAVAALQPGQEGLRELPVQLLVGWVALFYRIRAGVQAVPAG